MQEFSFELRALGTTVTVSLIGVNEALAIAAFANIRSRLLAVEERFSRFLPQSELSQLNRIGHRQVSPEFKKVFETAQRLYVETHGAFNPLVQVARLGYQKSYDTLAGEQVVLDTNYNTTFTDIEGPDEMGNLRLTPGQQLDFGGFLKGYMAHDILQELRSEAPWCSGAIINIGGDIATFGLDAVHEPFIFTIYNPVTEEETPVTLRDTCLATSGTYGRTWSTASGAKHHLVDPVTHTNTTTNCVSVSVIHQDGALAEAYTKMFFVYGVDRTLELLGDNVPKYLVIDSRGTTSSNCI